MINLPNYFDGIEVPPALDKNEISKLINDFKNGSLKAREELISHNIRLVFYEVAKKFYNVDYDKEELVSIGQVGLIKAIDTFDVEKGFEFTTYAVRCIDNEILMFLRKLKNRVNVESLETIVHEDKDGNKIKLEDFLGDDQDLVEDVESKDIKIILRKLVDQLPEREKEIIMLSFGFYNDKEYTQDEIAKKFNLSQSYVSRLINQIIKKLRLQLADLDVIEISNTEKNRKRLQAKYQIKVQTDDNEIPTQQPIDQMCEFLEERKTQPAIENIKTPIFETSSLKNNNTEINDFSKSDYIKMRELLKTPEFTQLIKTLNAKDAIIIALKFGYIDGKYFSNESIAEFLGINLEEILEIIRKVIFMYKENINNYIDNAVIVEKTSPKLK